MSKQSKQQIYKNKFYKLLKWIIPIGILIFLVSYVKPAELLDRLKHANVNYIAVAFILVIPNLFIQYLKWALVCRNFLGVIDNRKIIKSLFYGIGGGAFTPMQVGEYFARALPFREKKISEILVATAIDKMVTIIVLTVFSSLAALFFVVTNGLVEKVLTNQLFIGIVIGLFIIGLMIIFRKYFRKLIWNRLIKIKIIQLIIQNITKIKILKTRTIIVLFILTIIFYLTFTMQLSFLIGAFANGLNLKLYLLIANLVVFAQVVLSPLGIGHVGVREAAAVFFVEIYGMAGAIGLNAAVFLFLMNLVLPAIIGLILFVTRDNP